MKWHIDYLVVTVWGRGLQQFYNDFFDGYFRPMSCLGHGGRFYQNTYQTDLGVTLRTDPVGLGQPDRGTIEIPGRACQILGFDRLQVLFHVLRVKYTRVCVNRIDLAFDDCNFTIEDVEKCLYENNLRSYFKRETIRTFKNPFEKKDNGEIGTAGITVGSRTSTRYMRIYNKHGFTRLELEFKAEKAEQVAMDVLLAEDEKTALRASMGHVRDYVDFFEKWWKYFVMNYDRLYSTLPNEVKAMNIQQIKSWFESQIASAFYTIATIEGSDYLETLYQKGSEKYRRSRYAGFVEMN